MQELPPLGASPDGIVVHCVRAPPILAAKLQDPKLDKRNLPQDILRELLDSVRFVR